ncbi:acyltransferase family protein [Acinetobacter nosocomialis]|uniref:acyltransferase family protein n=1 Tax=Acinetobacter nosocomialis TaxID=106654 RepID=UPI0024DEB7A5|nr:acyltransferase [Acinetobacter nosocomialis]
MIPIYLYTIVFFILFIPFCLSKYQVYECIIVKNQNPINGLRAILASIVMFSHTYKDLFIHTGNEWMYTQGKYFEYIGWGNQALNAGKIGVAIFFMISGYLFYSLLEKARFDSFLFLKQRLKRIFPLYFFVITFCVFYNYIALSELKLSDIILPYIKWILFFGDDSTLKLMGMTGGVEWTLKIEILMYLTIPVLFLLFHKLKNKLQKHILIICSVLLVFFISYILRLYFEFYLDPRASLCFYVGYFTLDIKNVKLIDFIKSKTFALISLLFFISALFVTANNFLYIYLIFACSFIFIAAAKGNDIFGVLKNKQMQKLGEISYSIYLTHGVVLFFLMKFAGLFLSFGAAGSFVFIFIHFFLTFTVSVFTYTYVEQWFNRPHFRSLLLSKFKQL